MGRWSQDRQFEQPFGRRHVPRGPPPARNPEPPAPSSARQRPRGQCGAGGGLRGGDCLRLAGERKVGHGRPAERGGNRAVAGERRRGSAGGGRSPRLDRARPPRSQAWRERWRRGAPARLCSCGRRRWGGPGLGERPRRNPRDSAQLETRAGRVGARRLPCAAAGRSPAPGGGGRLLGERARGALWVGGQPRKAAWSRENAGRERHSGRRAGARSHRGQTLAAWRSVEGRDVACCLRKARPSRFQMD